MRNSTRPNAFESLFATANSGDGSLGMAALEKRPGSPVDACRAPHDIRRASTVLKISFLIVGARIASRQLLPTQ
jgi:hypothetical protein